MNHYDMVVIGGGNTGLAVANRVSRAGRHVALIDKGPVGGLQDNRGHQYDRLDVPHRGAPVNNLTIAAGSVVGSLQM